MLSEILVALVGTAVFGHNKLAYAPQREPEQFVYTISHHRFVWSLREFHVEEGHTSFTFEENVTTYVKGEVYLVLKLKRQGATSR